ncbi:hypothetical protein [Lacipirellula sp.]|uniref:hypothetical protein n=1 Tax=Lacipirellula sp. TaxID=2691419 RepID=UPI003D0CCDDD
MIRSNRRTIGVVWCFAAFHLSEAAAVDRVVSTTAQFSAALAAAGAGDAIILQPGTYGGGHFRANLQGVTIRSADPANQAIIDGGSNGIQLSDPANVTIADLVFRNQTGNGLNIDDGGTFETPATNLALRNITVRDIVTAGNNDGIKLSGVNDFLIENVRVLNWGVGGSAVDMVGCHRGLIQNSNFTHTNSANSGTTLQPKGGCKDITFRANRIDLPRGSGRAVQAGGSTGTPFFRFVDGDSDYEANQIVAEGNVIIGGSSSFSWVNIDGGAFHHNVVSRPGQWVARILNENSGSAIVDTQNGSFHDNRIVYNDTASEFSTAVNVGPETLPNTFTFARNEWLNLANPTAAGSTPSLPTPETGGVYGVGSATAIDEPQVWNFAWGKWIVNANATPQSVDVSGLQGLRQASGGAGATFHPLNTDPLDGAWTLANVPASTLTLPAFSQAILIDPGVHLSLAGDYDDDGDVDGGDFLVWQRSVGSAAGALPNDPTGVAIGPQQLSVWKSNFGASAGSVLAVPEPATRVLWLAGCAVVLRSRYIFL